MLRSSSFSLPTRRFASSLSTRPSRRHPRASPEPSSSDEQSPTPRYLRRQAQFGSPDKPSTKFPRKSSSKVAVNKQGNTIILLEPHVLSERLKKLCDRGKFDDAVNYLKSSPLDAQNTPVWNTLIWECMKAGKYSTGFTLYTQMKRRGFSPTTRTYATLFNGLARIQSWHSYTKQLKNADSTYTYFIRHLQSVKKEDSRSTELDISPLAAYIRILGEAGEYQKIFDVYYELEPSGPLAPNHLIFTAMFTAIAKFNAAARKQLNATPAGVVDTKLLWKQTVKASEHAKGIEIDPHLVTCAIQALSGGRQPEQTLAFQLVRDYFGLTKPGDNVTTGKFPLSPQTLIAALMLCNSSHKPTLCLHYHQQLTEPRSKLYQQRAEDLLDRGHMEEVLKAHITLAALGAPGQAALAVQTLEYMIRREFTASNGPRIRPTKTTYDLVLMACFRGADWASACTTFQLMTGLRTSDFTSDKSAADPRQLQRSPNRNLAPDAETMSSVLRTAIASSNPTNVAQSLRMVNHLTAEQLLTPAHASKKQAKHERFYQAKLAQALTDAVDIVAAPASKKGMRTRGRQPSEDSSSSHMVLSEQQITHWKQVRDRLKPDLAIRPYLEQDIRAVKEVDSFVEYKTVQKHTMSPLNMHDVD